jgi:selenium-binding protein 1
VSGLGSPDGHGPGGLFTIDQETFDVMGRWEIDRGPQTLSSDFSWHLGHDVAITGEWGPPQLVDDGLVPDALMAGLYGHRLHVWDRRTRSHVDVLDLGRSHQMILALRQAHDPTRAYGFVGAALSAPGLAASVWLWHRGGHNGARRWMVQRVIDIPAERAPAGELPPVLQPLGVVPPLVTGLALSLDDRYLFVTCWGTGELRRYDVGNPFEPRLAGVVRLGGIGRRTPHPGRPGLALSGGPRRVELSRDGRRAYVTNSFGAAWDAQFYPDGVEGWMAKVDVEGAGMRLDDRFFVQFEGLRPQQVRLEGGDASSDSFCYA